MKRLPSGLVGAAAVMIILIVAGQAPALVFLATYSGAGIGDYQGPAGVGCANVIVEAFVLYAESGNNWVLAWEAQFPPVPDAGGGFCFGSWGGSAARPCPSGQTCFGSPTTGFSAEATVGSCTETTTLGPLGLTTSFRFVQRCSSGVHVLEATLAFAGA